MKEYNEVYSPSKITLQSCHKGVQLLGRYMYLFVCSVCKVLCWSDGGASSRPSHPKATFGNIVLSWGTTRLVWVGTG
eukprot:5274835-Pyramimonas_sp.AAC.1